jgi:hypothetical protein
MTRLAPGPEGTFVGWRYATPDVLYRVDAQTGARLEWVALPTGDGTESAPPWVLGLVRGRDSAVYVMRRNRMIEAQTDTVYRIGDDRRVRGLVGVDEARYRGLAVLSDGTVVVALANAAQGGSQTTLVAVTGSRAGSTLDVLPITLSTSRAAIVVSPRDGSLFLQAIDGTLHRYDLVTRTLARLPVGGLTALLDADDSGRLYAMSIGPEWWAEQHPLVVIDPATGAVQQRWPPSDVDGVVLRDGWIYGSAEFTTAAFWRLPVAAAR